MSDGVCSFPAASLFTHAGTAGQSISIEPIARPLRSSSVVVNVGASIDASPEIALLLEFWPYALRGAKPEELLAFLFERGFTVGKATEAPYPMRAERILRQALARDPVRGGIDLYAVRGRPFHVTSAANRLRALVRSLKEP